MALPANGDTCADTFEVCVICFRELRVAAEFPAAAGAMRDTIPIDAGDGIFSAEAQEQTCSSEARWDQELNRSHGALQQTSLQQTSLEEEEEKAAEEEAEVPVQLRCRHMFCRACIDRWLTVSARCPVCRKRARFFASHKGPRAAGPTGGNRAETSNDGTAEVRMPATSSTTNSNSATRSYESADTASSVIPGNAPQSLINHGEEGSVVNIARHALAEIELPAAAVGRVIGRRGATLRDIRITTGAHVYVNKGFIQMDKRPLHAGTALLVGTPEAVRLARARVQSIVGRFGACPHDDHQSRSTADREVIERTSFNMASENNHIDDNVDGDHGLGPTQTIPLHAFLKKAKKKR